jgi:hypothetical protein
MRAKRFALLLYSLVALTSCANDQTAWSEASCDEADCRHSCIGPSCPDADMDEMPEREVDDVDLSQADMAPTEMDAAEEHLTGDALDSDLDASSDDAAGASDSIEDGDAISAADSIFTLCASNADCPLPGTVCMTEFPLSHQLTGIERRSFDAREVLGIPLSAGPGVCTASCVSPLEDCRFTDVSGALVVWECQLIAVSDRVHPGVDSEWSPVYPLDAPVDDESMSRGQPFSAICRPNVTDSRSVPVCSDCTRDADCGDGTCWDPVEAAGVERSDGIVQGYCLDHCVTDADCAFGFACRDAGTRLLCIPLEGTCTDCLDIDGDEYGVGRCTAAGSVSSVDCNDRDALSYYRGMDGLPDPSRCAEDTDSNCNGINDDAELVGPGLWGAIHCQRCGDICDATVVEDVSLVNGVVVCRDSESGGNECGTDCAAGFADCNGILADGCETPTGTDTDCSGCGDNCLSIASGVPSGSCSGTLDGVSACVITECPTGTADCNGIFRDGCEMDTTSTLQNCGACGLDCTDRFAQAIESCVDSRCAIASCASGFADCDRTPATGCESDIRLDSGNCGACGTVCNLANAISECVSSRCVIAACRDGYADCDGLAANGCESNLSSSIAHCGGCNQSCSVPGGIVACTDGECTLARCAAGLLDCSSTAPGCETDGTSVGNCGSCGELCTSVPAGLRACSPNSARTVWSCQCDDSSFSRQECDGEFNRCGESVDQGCPVALGRVGTLALSGWGVTVTGFLSPAPVADQILPGTGGLILYRYLYGLELDWDDSTIIQIRPLWLDPVPLSGVGTGRDYPFYGPAQPLNDSSIRSAAVLGIPDASINTTALSVAGVSFTLDHILSCPRAPGAPSHAFALPVALRLYSGASDTLLSAVGLLCQTYEIRFRGAVGVEPTSWYELVPYGAAREVGPAGPGSRFRQQVPQSVTGEVGTPIVGIQADTSYASWPQYLGASIRQDISVFRAIRVNNAVSWGLL